MSRRAGKPARISANRYFYVMGEGWYVLTREGESGPYPEKDKAEEFVNIVLTGSQSINFDTIPASQ
ncbi:MAG: hypothetical protein LJE74_02625 [Proteobacteria bacterium]|nr:hypothetical protein [Pseudomonadota bacterium]MCG6936066.1 hypothetical protein [Pseudomonadota bacterium]